MKIIFDTDGTLTNFNKFINLNALKYFEQEYGMTIVNPKALELEDIFDMDNFFAKKYIIDKEEAKQYTKKAIDEFVAKIDPKNTTEILQYGSSAQNNISKFSDSIRVNSHTA